LTEHINERGGERIEVWRGYENIVRKGFEILAMIKNEYDLCLDSNGSSLIILEERAKKAYEDLRNRHIKIRLITEITKNNIPYCKETCRWQRFAILMALKVIS
jgi:hypothetical protein